MIPGVLLPGIIGEGVEAALFPMVVGGRRLLKRETIVGLVLMAVPIGVMFVWHPAWG